MFEAVQSQGVGGGGWSKSKISYLCFCEVRVNSPVVCPMAADLKTMYFQGKMQEFVGKWDRGFSPATKRMAPGYFYWKRKQK